jgi:hypothetical protein
MAEVQNLRSSDALSLTSDLFCTFKAHDTEVRPEKS